MIFFWLKGEKCGKNADGNIRNHLGRIHKMYDYMYESQRPPKIESKSLTKETSKKLNEAILECIIEDPSQFL